MLRYQAAHFKDSERVTFRTRKAGILEVRRANDDPSVGPDDYALALPTSRVEQREMPDLLAALGVDAPCFDTVEGAEQTTIILLDDEDAVRALNARYALARTDRPDGDLHSKGHMHRCRQPRFRSRLGRPRRQRNRLCPCRANPVLGETSGPQ